MERIAKNIIKVKYGECLQLESELAKSDNKEQIDFFKTGINQILTDIEIIAHSYKISQDELDAIFSEVRI